MQLIFEQIRVGGDRNFGYLLGDREAKLAVLIDPSYSPEVLVQRAADQELTISHIINTHGHADHINGNGKAKELTGALIAAHPLCPVLLDLPLEDGQDLAVGALRLKFWHTPGHSEDHLVVYEQSHRILMTGDLIFVGKVGGTANDSDAREQFNSIQQVLQHVPDVATVWPGHDYGVRPSSTVAMERKTNPFIQCQDIGAFNRLKDDWPIFKKLHGLK